MKIEELSPRFNIDKNVKFKETYSQFEKFLIELRKRELPDEITMYINKGIDEINSMADSGDELRKIVRKKQATIIQFLEKEIKLVPKNYYRNHWLAVGMAAFGLPIGTILGTSLGNMAFLGIGLPIGMAIGIYVGTGMDNKACKEERQLDIEIKQ
ncbi:MAG: hypothetical protein ACLFNU_08980 [Bacteroidales bacterium]